MVAERISLDFVLAFLAEGVPPQAILDLSMAEEDEFRIETLRSKSNRGDLSTSERREVEDYLLLSQIVNLAKAKAMLRMNLTANG